MVQMSGRPPLPMTKASIGASLASSSQGGSISSSTHSGHPLARRDTLCHLRSWDPLVGTPSPHKQPISPSEEVEWVGAFLTTAAPSRPPESQDGLDTPMARSPILSPQCIPGFETWPLSLKSKKHRSGFISPLVTYPRHNIYPKPLSSPSSPTTGTAVSQPCSDSQQ